MKNFDLTGALMDYEAGQLDNKGVLVLFSHLIKTGVVWSLQGSYGRTARALIERGYLTKNGKIMNESDD